MQILTIEPEIQLYPEVLSEDFMYLVEEDSEEGYDELEYMPEESEYPMEVDEYQLLMWNLGLIDYFL